MAKGKKKKAYAAETTDHPVEVCTCSSCRSIRRRNAEVVISIHESKYILYLEFKAGVRAALEGAPLLDGWSEATLTGYHYGREVLHPMLSERLNAYLMSFGHQPISVLKG